MIQQLQRPLSPADKTELSNVLKSAGYQRLKDVVLAHQAFHTINAGTSAMVNDDGGITAKDEADSARFFERMFQQLVTFEAEGTELFAIELKIAPS